MESEETVAGDIYIGCGETDALHLLARSAKALQEQYPGIHYHISSGDNLDVTERLERGLYCFLIKQLNYPISACNTGNNGVGQRANGIA